MKPFFLTHMWTLCTGSILIVTDALLIGFGTTITPGGNILYYAVSQQLLTASQRQPIRSHNSDRRLAYQESSSQRQNIALLLPKLRFWRHSQYCGDLMTKTGTNMKLANSCFK